MFRCHHGAPGHQALVACGILSVLLAGITAILVYDAATEHHNQDSWVVNLTNGSYMSEAPGPLDLQSWFRAGQLVSYTGITTAEMEALHQESTLQANTDLGTWSSSHITGERVNPTNGHILVAVGHMLHARNPLRLKHQVTVQRAAASIGETCMQIERYESYGSGLNIETLAPGEPLLWQMNRTESPMVDGNELTSCNCHTFLVNPPVRLHHTLGFYVSPSIQMDGGVSAAWLADLFGTSAQRWDDWLQHGTATGAQLGNVHSHTTPLTLDFSSTNGRNEVFSARIVSPASTIAVTNTWYDTVSREIVEWDMVYDTDVDWASDGSSTKIDRESVIVHEFGHALGLGHTAGCPDASMHATVAAGETKKRTLEACSDVVGAVALYGFSTGDVLDDVLDGVGDVLDDFVDAFGGTGSRLQHTGVWPVMALLLLLLLV